MQIVITLQCLGNYDKKKRLYMFSRDAIFFKKYFLSVADEPADVELIDMEDCLYS
jgi:hypothetical protein